MNAHLMFLSPWTHMSPREKAEHIDTCEGCDEVCAPHRADVWCDLYGRQVVITDEGVCPDCGNDHLNERRDR